MHTPWEYNCSDGADWWEFHVHWRGEPNRPRRKQVKVTCKDGDDHIGYFYDAGARVYVEVTMATLVYTDPMLMENTDIVDEAWTILV